MWTFLSISIFLKGIWFQFVIDKKLGDYITSKFGSYILRT